MSSEMAWRAASLTSAGAAKSGKPCERFTALCFIASRVISRITDSVNCSALAEIMRREICAIFASGLLIDLRLASASNVRTIRLRHLQNYRLCDVAPDEVDTVETGAAAGV